MTFLFSSIEQSVSVLWHLFICSSSLLKNEICRLVSGWQSWSVTLKGGEGWIWKNLHRSHLVLLLALWGIYFQSRSNGWLKHVTCPFSNHAKINMKCIQHTIMLTIVSFCIDIRTNIWMLNAKPIPWRHTVGPPPFPATYDCIMEMTKAQICLHWWTTPVSKSGILEDITVTGSLGLL